MYLFIFFLFFSLEYQSIDLAIMLEPLSQRLDSKFLASIVNNELQEKARIVLVFFTLYILYIRGPENFIQGAEPFLRSYSPLSLLCFQFVQNGHWNEGFLPNKVRLFVARALRYSCVFLPPFLVFNCSYGNCGARKNRKKPGIERAGKCNSLKKTKKRERENQLSCLFRHSFFNLLYPLKNLKSTYAIKQKP